MSTSTPTDAKAKKLETVRALLAKAEGTDNPHEADAFRQKADQMMQAFAIEQWMVEEAQAGVNARPKPEIRHMDFSWWSGRPFSGQLWSLYLDVAHHCRVVVAMRGQGANGNYRQMPVIGLASDIDYFDMLFTSLMVQMGTKLEPKPDLSKSLGENAYNLRAAGIDRMRVIRLLAEAGYLGDEDEWKPAYGWANPDQKKVEKRLRAKVRVAAEKYARENNLDSTTDMGGLRGWQLSFAEGFVRELDNRMMDMRRDTATGDSASVAIALRDIRQVANDLYTETWPAPEPCEACAEGNCKVHKKSRAVTRRGPRLNHTAYRSGKKAGSEANLSNPASKRVGNTRGQLGR